MSCIQFIAMSRRLLLYVVDSYVPTIHCLPKAYITGYFCVLNVCSSVLLPQK